MQTENRYGAIREFRDHNMHGRMTDFTSLNSLHEQVMTQTVTAAIEYIQANFGPPPCNFCFFIMGSAARAEQAIWSDQDHGLIYYDKSPDTQDYFLKLGEEISEALEHTGYKKCNGNVMASNPLWCKSQSEWQQQIEGWLDEANWKGIRHLLTFIDGRALYGETKLIDQMKITAYESIHEKQLLRRTLENTLHIKKSTGVFGQFLLETYGNYTGALNIKETGLLPYVNAARLLAIHERIIAPSTVARIQQLSEQLLLKTECERIACHFSQLQNFRLLYGLQTDYEAGHFLPIAELSKQEKNQLKELLQTGTQFFEFAKNIIKKGRAQWQ